MAIFAAIEVRIILAAVASFFLHAAGHDHLAFPIDAIVAIAAIL